jgi:hypothetical protein
MNLKTLYVKTVRSSRKEHISDDTNSPTNPNLPTASNLLKQPIIPNPHITHENMTQKEINPPNPPNPPITYENMTQKEIQEIQEQQSDKGRRYANIRNDINKLELDKEIKKQSEYLRALEFEQDRKNRNKK